MTTPAINSSGQYLTSTNNLVNKLSKGLARTNKYLIEFSLPKGFSDGLNPGVNSESSEQLIRGVERSLNNDNTIGLMCHSCTLPSRAIETYTHKQLVSDYSVPKGIQQYEPVTFSLYADGDLNTRRYFDVWQSSVVNIGSNTLNYYNEYTSDIKISVIGGDGMYSPYFVTLYDAWPMNVGEIALAYSQNNVFMSVTVTMAYKYWTSSFISTARGVK